MALYGRFSRRFPLLSPTFMLRRKALTQGVFGDSRFWQFIAFVLVARRVIRKIMGSDPIVVARERVRPGETIILTGLLPKK
jgi:hypothetical protein